MCVCVCACVDRYPLDDSDDVIPEEIEEGEEGGDWQEGDEEEGIEEGKRGRMFIGKRGRLFVGKRGRRMFVGKRGRMFIGKRGRLFVGKRRIILRPISRVNKRSPADEATNHQFVDSDVANVATVVKRSTSVKVNSFEPRTM